MLGYGKAGKEPEDYPEPPDKRKYMRSGEPPLWRTERKPALVDGRYSLEFCIWLGSEECREFILRKVAGQ